jgi:hypothetical protein
MDNPIVTPTGTRRKRAKIVELDFNGTAEIIRKRGVDALDRKLAVEEFLSEVEIARKWFSVPQLRAFLELPADELDAEIEHFRALADKQTSILRDAVQRWSKLTAKEPTLGNFQNPENGGAA